MMRILIIKQTSLGDVLHSTGHIRAIREQYPDAHITLLTADTSADIYRDNPHIDRMVEFQRYRIKDVWNTEPGWVLQHFRQTFRDVNKFSYDLAIDLQGRWKSVIFLYAAKATVKVVKGRWWGLRRFRDRSLHALVEMDRVLEVAGVSIEDHSMEFFCSADIQDRVADLLAQHDLRPRQFLVLSPFTRWSSKNWSLQHYRELISVLPRELGVVISGAPADREILQGFLSDNQLDHVVNLCGSLNLREFAELVRNASGLVSGDSFAMHVAAACHTPVIALFGSTDERKVGPDTSNSTVMRGPANCARCYKKVCPQRCIDSITAPQVLDALEKLDCLKQPASASV